MSDLPLEIIGWLGATLVLAGYALLSAGKLPSTSFVYHGLNIAGSLLLAFYALFHGAIASVTINVIWVGIGVFAIWKARKQHT